MAGMDVSRIEAMGGEIEGHGMDMSTGMDVDGSAGEGVWDDEGHDFGDDQGASACRFRAIHAYCFGCWRCSRFVSGSVYSVCRFIVVLYLPRCSRRLYFARPAELLVWLLFGLSCSDRETAF